jgi:succinoglycan biosynthesis protein ExoM
MHCVDQAREEAEFRAGRPGMRGNQGATVKAISEPDYIARLFLAELAEEGDSRATQILKLLAGDASADRAAGLAGASALDPCRAAIAVCTAKRPKMLRHCLQSIAAQSVPPQVAVDVVVVDNEAEPNNRDLVEELAAHCPFPVHYVHEPRRGISRARNAALEKVRSLKADWVAFTDDDCWVSPTWLASLVDAAARHGADVVYGRREFLFPMPLPFWAMRAEQGTYAEGQALPYAATHNVLLPSRLIAGRSAMRFDERLAHGEDTDFFHRAAQRGVRIVYSAEPLVLEVVSPDRATFHYQARRAYYYAASRSYFHRRYKGARKAVMKLAARCVFHAPVAIVRLLAAPFAWPFSQDAFRGLVSKGTARLAGAAGAAAGLIGLDGNPYRSIDGY